MLHYNITKFITLSPMRFWLLSILFFISAFSYAAEQAESTHLRVIASIKPVHSMVAAIMHGVGRPDLLLTSNQSPHHYSLKPSERRLLAHADLIFWIGPNLESFLPRLFSSLDKEITLISLIDTSGLTLHALRQPGHHADDATHDTQEGNQLNRIDAHIWLNTHNIELMLDEITRQLVNADPDNAQQYKNNNNALHNKVEDLRTELTSLLKEKQRPFLTYHDGYQYFETEFNLKNAGFVSIDPELRPSAHHIQTLKETMHEHSIQCIFYDAPFEPPIIGSLLHDDNAKAVELDPTGLRLPAGKETLFQIMLSLGKKFHDCL